jgi:CRISPR-associated protein Cmr2
LNPEKRFLKAISFCLSRDGYGGDAEALAEWALSGGGEEPAPEVRGLKVALVSGGATKIKEYVFESARLPEIRGASELLDRINTEDVPHLWSKPEPVGIGCEECVIYAGGGEVLAFAPLCKAQWLADEVERIYSQETMVAQSVVVWQAFDLNQFRHGLLGEDLHQTEIERLLGYNPAGGGGFGSLILPLAAARYRRREGNTEGGRELRSIAHVETVPFARRCSSCERRAAVVNARVGEDNDRPLCEPCARKRVFGQLTKRKGADIGWWDDAGFRWQPDADGRQVRSWATRFEDWLDDAVNPKSKSQYAVNEDGSPLNSVRELEAVRDIGEIAQASTPLGFIGFVYADGNDMGRLLEALQTPADYAIFAEEFSGVLREATFAALAKHLRPVQVTREGRADKILVHPFEILNLGGDDLLLIVPAHVALPLACDIALDVEQQLPRLDPKFGLSQVYKWAEVQRCCGEPPGIQCKVGLSAGVVIADAHTPVFYLEELATQLLKSAKGRAKWLKQRRGYFGGTVDFLSLKSVTTLSGTIRQFRDSALTKEGGRLYARPYTLVEARALLKTVKLMKAAKFPRGQFYRLRESLHAGVMPSTVDYRYFLTRGEMDVPRRKIEELWTPVGGKPPSHPWRERLEQKGTLETIWPDVVELYDFVPAEDGEDAGNQD